ncbi:rhomboid-like protein [Streptomyces sp. A1499]|uniref:rhomboid-like protein n=1 Tax=Streptomyces sp. A1499 TaxID=2563104 RepID=UPI001F10AF72|nr:rhomboid-like protein [Streptomyces sp. A1499]
MNQSVEPVREGPERAADAAPAGGEPERAVLNAIPAQPDHRPAGPGSGAAIAAQPGHRPANSRTSIPAQPDHRPPGPGSGAVVRGEACPPAVNTPARRAIRPRKLLKLLPSPRSTPFTFGYALVLTVTSLLARYADPQLVSSLLRGSSTDVAHLVHSPALVLVASALWIAGGIASPYAIGFLLVLTALERRIGGLRTAGVFLLGHVVATLATEVPVGLSVLAGHLPDSSLHRLDYGISFGVAASAGALAGLLPRWAGWTALAGFGWVLVDDLIAFEDPMTNWGHLLALAIGVATWPLLRRARRSPRGPRAQAATASTTERNAAVGSTRVSLSSAAASSAANSSRVRS